MTVEFFVPGVPAPKGSYTPVKRGNKVWMMPGKGAAVARYGEWAARIRSYATIAMRANAQPLTGDPVAVDCTFYLPRPKTVSALRVHAATKPDLDKPFRLVGDCVTGIAITEDSRIVEIVARKMYSAPGREGALVRIWSV